MATKPSSGGEDDSEPPLPKDVLAEMEYDWDGPEYAYDEDGPYVPERYRSEQRPYEHKPTLYELYWGKLLSTTEIAALFDVDTKNISLQLRRHGIPRRVREACVTIDANSYNVLDGFLTDAESAQMSFEWVGVCRPKYLPPYDDRDADDVSRSGLTDDDGSEHERIEWTDLQ